MPYYIYEDHMAVLPPYHAIPIHENNCCATLVQTPASRSTQKLSLSPATILLTSSPVCGSHCNESLIPPLTPIRSRSVFKQIPMATSEEDYFFAASPVRASRHDLSLMYEESADQISTSSKDYRHGEQASEQVSFRLDNGVVSRLITSCQQSLQKQVKKRRRPVNVKIEFDDYLDSKEAEYQTPCVSRNTRSRTLKAPQQPNS
uniref:Uncharacterized protein n=1 Tax=Spongospora subterranea TaxID=70186 RepID=A0A0H5QGY0_9EUKA|eukprot:CRZ01253.1 hypothetical protein [Spongospora subterranea]